MRGNRKLSAEERILWSRVARTATPLPGKEAALLSEPESQPQDNDAPKVVRGAASLTAGRSHEGHHDRGRLHALDAPTRRKLTKGRLPLEARIDLHGLTQAEAHTLLLSFLHRAHGQGLRHVLVITGKGSSLGSDGILRRAVPAWFATPPFRPLVSGYDDAARAHGGAGALYVRLRRQPPGHRG